MHPDAPVITPHPDDSVRAALRSGTHREIIEGRDGHVRAVYTVTGELFFASSNDLYTQFEGKTVEIIGLDVTSAERHERLTGQLPSH